MSDSHGKETPALVGAPASPVWVRALVVLGLVAATCILYFPVAGVGFFELDDLTYAASNPYIREITLSNLWTILTQPYFGNYAPMHILSYVVDHAIGGGQAQVFHVSNHVWGGIAAGMVYLLALRITRHQLAAIVAGLLFVAHPVHVEAVAWISSRKDLVAAAFAVPAVLCYLRFRDGGTRAIAWYVTSVVLFLLATAAKQSVIVLPGVLFLIDWMVESRRLLPSILDKIPYGVIAAFFALRTLDAQPSAGLILDSAALGRNTIQFLWLLTGSGEHVIFRTRPDVPGGLPGVLLGWLTWALVLAPFLFKRWMPGWTGVLVCWLLAALLPSMAMSFTNPIADRYLFFPSVALCLLIAVGIAAVRAEWGMRGLAAVVAAAVALGGWWTMKTVTYVGEWSDARTVFYAASGKTEDPEISYFLGTTYFDLATAVPSVADGSASPEIATRARAFAARHWEDDVRLARLLDEWEMNTAGGPATRDFEESLYDFAWEQFETAVRRQNKRAMPGLYYRRGQLCMKRGELDRAEAEFVRTMLEAQHKKRVGAELYVRSLHSVGIIWRRRGDYPKALEQTRLAHRAQQQLGVIWIPDLPEQCAKLERLAGERP